MHLRLMRREKSYFRVCGEAEMFAAFFNNYFAFINVGDHVYLAAPVDKLTKKIFTEGWCLDHLRGNGSSKSVTLL